MTKPSDYSSQSYSPGSKGPLKSTATNNIDSSGKSKDKNDIAGHNDKLIEMIEQRKQLEADNKKLQTKLNILKEKEDYEGKIDEIAKQLANNMKQQIETLLNDKDKLKAELHKIQEELEDTRNSYEDELAKKAMLEIEFVIKKKDVDDGHLKAVYLALELEDLMGKLDFLRIGFDEEIKEMESQVQNETVVLHDSTKRSLDMDDIIHDVTNQYAMLASRSREEAEQWNQKKMDFMVLNAVPREQEVRDLKREVSDHTRHIQRLNGDLEALTRKEESLTKDIIDVRTEGNHNLESARKDIAQLEVALKQAKQHLAGQIREHQELMNLKLALDIEIATYRKLLEGEEQRMNYLMRHADVYLPSKQHLPEKPRSPKPFVVPADTVIPALYPTSKKRLLIRVEVEEGRVVSEISHYSED